MMLYGGTYPDHICRHNKKILNKHENVPVFEKKTQPSQYPSFRYYNLNIISTVNMEMFNSVLFLPQSTPLSFGMQVENENDIFSLKIKHRVKESFLQM